MHSGYKILIYLSWECCLEQFDIYKETTNSSKKKNSGKDSRFIICIRATLQIIQMILIRVRSTNPQEM